jgi:hypothetical protein
MRTWIDERRSILAAVVVSRALVFGSAVVSHGLGWPHAPTVPMHIASRKRALTYLGYWDGPWYRNIAEHGYLLIPGRQSDPAFFPLFPMLLRAVHGLGLSYLTDGLLLSNAAFLCGILVFYELGRRIVSTEIARTGAIIAALFPMSYVFSMTYPESIVFAALSLALLFAVERRWSACAVAGAVAALTRPEALFFALPLVAIAVEQERAAGRLERGRAVGAALAPLASLAAFPLYLGWTLHDVFAWSCAQQAWGRSFQLGGFARAFEQLNQAGQSPWLWRDAGFAVLFLALLAAAHLRGVPLVWVLAGAAIVLAPLASGTLISDARFGLLALPAYWGLALVTRRAALRRGLLVVSAALLVGATMTLPVVNP